MTCARRFPATLLRLLLWCVCFLLSHKSLPVCIPHTLVCLSPPPRGWLACPSRSGRVVFCKIQSTLFYQHSFSTALLSSMEVKTSLKKECSIKKTDLLSATQHRLPAVFISTRHHRSVESLVGRSLCRRSVRRRWRRLAGVELIDARSDVSQFKLVPPMCATNGVHGMCV